MNLLRSSSQISALCEISHDATRVMIVKSNGTSMGVLGFAEVLTEGYTEGRFVNLSDVAEGVRGAVDQAGREAHYSPRKITVNLDDPFLESAIVHGSMTLEKSSDVFTADHVQEATGRALSSVQPSEKVLVYQGVSKVMVDGEETQDWLPGHFGKNLSVELCLLYSDSQQVQNLSSIMKRADLELCSYFPTGFAALRGFLDETVFQTSQAVVVANQGVCHLVLTSNTAIHRYVSMLVLDGYSSVKPGNWDDAVRTFCQKRCSEIYLTGDLCESPEVIRLFEQTFNKPIRFGSPRVEDPCFQSPRYSTLIGLAWLNRTRRAIKGPRRPEALLIQKIKTRAKSFIQEYF